MTIETIVAIATPPGQGGVGIIRISGPLAYWIAEKITRITLIARTAHFCRFYKASNEILDEGIALYFNRPHSFTGEDVVELQGHGGPVVLDCLLQQVTEYGARLARPGEFSERAFLNGKMDLTQAEAVADLITASSQQAAKSAVRSLCGEFSQQIKTLLEQLIQLRMYVEAAIDFPEEEINFLTDGHVLKNLEKIQVQVQAVKRSAKQGTLLRDGMTVVLTGKPNVGKSSLLNALSGEATAIVTQIPGTTRDLLKEKINIDGMPLHVIDTAGLRDSQDIIEQEGINRAKTAISTADEIIYIIDANEEMDLNELIENHFSGIDCDRSIITVIKNKIDLVAKKPMIIKESGHDIIYLSAKNKEGIDLVREHLKKKMGYQLNIEGVFIARRRHLQALEKAEHHLQIGYQQLTKYNAGEFLAEELRITQQALGEITGDFTTEDLLGKIFSTFCIGK